VHAAKSLRACRLFTLEGTQLTATASVRLWHGPDRTEALAAYGRAIDAGFSELRARIFGSIASWPDCWTLQSTLARFHKCSVRTIQRASHSAREIGFLRCAWSKPGEKPPGADAPVPFKWCHRWIPGRGLAGPALQSAINKARAAWVITKASIRRTYNAPVSRPVAKRQFTAAELDDALAAPERQAMRDRFPARGEERSQKRVTAAELDAILNAHEPEPPDR
jgi:hypothetical protein